MKQTGIGKFFGGKDIESTKKNAIIKKAAKDTLLSDFDALIKKIKITTESEPTIPKDVSTLISWKAGESIPFSVLAKELDEIEELSGKNEIVEAHNFAIRESSYNAMEKLKNKYGLSIYKLTNIAIYNALNSK